MPNFAHKKIIKHQSIFKNSLMLLAKLKVSFRSPSAFAKCGGNFFLSKCSKAFYRSNYITNFSASERKLFKERLADVGGAVMIYSWKGAIVLLSISVEKVLYLLGHPLVHHITVK